MDAEHLPASGKRLLLAVYLDLVLFNAAAGILWYYVAPGQEPPWLKYVAFCALEAVLLLVVKWTPGERLLSVRQAKLPSDPIEPEGARTGRFQVDRRVWSRESFWTVLLGAFLITDGAKELVRWTMWTPPLPWFGTTVTPEWAVAPGLLGLLLGALVLRLHFAAPLAVLAVNLLYTASILLSWDLWPEFAKEAVTRRRAFQGLPVRAGEVEIMQATLLWGVLALLLAQAVIVVAYRRRFAKT